METKGSVLRLRSAVPTDCKLYWEWANDPTVRRASFHPEPIPWEEHQRWFEERIRSPRARLFIVEDEKPVGQVRLDYDEKGVAEIDISIFQAIRGRGYGARALRLASDLVAKDSQVPYILARIRSENGPSLCAFRKAGYIEIGRERVREFEAVRMIYPLAMQNARSKPRIAYMANNRLGLDILRTLRDAGETVAVLVLHPKEKARYRAEMEKLAPQALVLEGSSLRESATIAKFQAAKPDLILSVLFDYILRPEILQIPKLGAVNLHPSFLPYHRGNWPNVWSILEGTPAGVTLHYMDEGIDTGDIVAQRRVEILATDTGKTLYERLEAAGLELFRIAWPWIRSGEAPRAGQDGAGCVHRRADTRSLDRIDPRQSYRAIDLINLLRARTFPPYSGAYIEENGRKIFLRLECYEEGGDPGDMK